MYTITFYSFRGGVGRTLALVNVGAELARRGRRVLLVDFDLEAPALDTYALLSPPSHQAGLVDYISEYLSTEQVPSIEEYYYQAHSVGNKRGQLCVMRAGQSDGSYRSKLAEINWISLYRDHGGFSFFREMKRQWQEVINPDYVLIDCSRGRTNFEGICTRQLPEAVAMFLFPDTQNLWGTVAACNDIRTESQRGRPEEIHYQAVLSNLPAQPEITVAGWQALLREYLGVESTAILQHDAEVPTFSVHTPISVLDRPQSRLAQEYRQLVEDLIVENPADRDGALLMIRRLEQRYAQSASRQARVADEDRLEQIIRHFADDAEILLQAGRCRATGGDIEAAAQYIDDALERRPQWGAALLARASCESKLRQGQEATATLRAYLQGEDFDSKKMLNTLHELYRYCPQEFAALEGMAEVQPLLAPHNSERNRLFPPHLDRSTFTTSRNPDDVTNMPPWLQSLDRLERYKLCVLLHDRAVEQPSNPLQRLRKHIEDLKKRIEIRLGIQPPAESLLVSPSAHYLPYDYFELALAYWTATGELPEVHCRQGVEFAENVDAACYSTPDYCQLAAVALWRLGKIEEATRLLNRADEIVNRDSEDCEYCSYWRDYAGEEGVSRDQMTADIALFWQLIHGRLQHPAFLD